MNPLAVEIRLLLVVAIIASAHFSPRAQEPPTVDLDSAAEGAVSIEVLDEPDGAYLRPDSLREILRRVDGASSVEWDSPSGTLRIRIGGREMTARLGEAKVAIDGQARGVNAPLRMKSSGVIIPVQTAKVLLAALDLQLDIEDTAPSRMATQSGEMVMRVAGEETRVVESPEEPVAVRASTNTLPQLALPQGMAGATGLTWSQLTDAHHKRAPRKLVIAHDKELEKLAALIGETAARQAGLEVVLVGVAGRRSDPHVVSQIVGTYPDLLLDLMLSPTALSEGTDEKLQRSGGMEVWSVHGALWPEDAGGLAASARFPYRTHEFHNLALGSLLRGRLAATFPGRSVSFELSPSFLLRRVNAPSAAILISPALLGDRTNPADMAARAAGLALAEYALGMTAVTGTR